MKRKQTKLYKKVRSTSGESLLETLFAMLIIVLAMSMLAASIVVAARINAKGSRMVTEFQKSESDRKTAGKVKIDFTDSSITDPEEINVKVYTTDDTTEDDKTYRYSYKYYEEQAK